MLQEILGWLTHWVLGEWYAAPRPSAICLPMHLFHWLLLSCVFFNKPVNISKLFP